MNGPKWLTCQPYTDLQYPTKTAVFWNCYKSLALRVKDRLTKTYSLCYIYLILFVYISVYFQKTAL